MTSTNQKGWLVDPAQFNLGCSSHSCKYINHTGMGTNGPCNCATNLGARHIEMFLHRNYTMAMAKIKELEIALEIDKTLNE